MFTLISREQKSIRHALFVLNSINIWIHSMSGGRIRTCCSGTGALSQPEPDPNNIATDPQHPIIFPYGRKTQ